VDPTGWRRTSTEAGSPSGGPWLQGVPPQAFHLLPRIREVDAFLQEDPELGERLALLLEPRFPRGFGRIRPQFPRSRVGDDDDLIDALVRLRTAGRLARGEASGQPR